MRIRSALVLSIVLFAVRARAQTELPTVRVGPAHATVDSARPARAERPRAGRVVAEVITGTLAEPLAGVAGAVLSVPLDAAAAGAAGTNSATGTAVVTAGVAAGLSATAMTALAVSTAGNALGGHGRYTYALLGATIGSSVAAGLVAAAFGITSASNTRGGVNDDHTVSDTTAVVAVVGMFTLPVLGATLGYELSSRDGSPSRRPPATTIVPTVSASASGATVGVAGIF